MPKTTRFILAFALLIGAGLTLAGAQDAKPEKPAKFGKPGDAMVLSGEMEDIPLTELIQVYAENTGRTVLYDPKKLSGTVSFTAPTEGVKQTPEDILLSALAQFRLTLAFDGTFETVIPTSEAVTMADTAKREDIANYPPMRFVRVVVPLKNAEANAVRGALQNLTTRQGGVVNPIAGTNALILCDTAENLTKLLELVDDLDRSDPAISRVVRLKHVTYGDIENAVRSVTPRPVIGWTKDEKTLVLSGSASLIDSISEVIKALDVASEE